MLFCCYNRVTGRPAHIAPAALYTLWQRRNMQPNTDEILYRATLAAQELEGIRKLEALGAKKGVHYKIDPGTSSGIVCTQNGTLAGFMTMDCFGGGEIEAAAVASSIEDWDGMAAVLKARAKEQAAERLLFICDPNDVLVHRKLEEMGIRPSFTEYRMTFDAAAFAPAAIRTVSLRPAEAGDGPYIQKLDAEAFGSDGGPPSPHDIATTQIILHSGARAGKLRIEGTADAQGLYGVIVESRLRGKGIGAQALTLLLNQLVAGGARNVYLEVDSGNPAAFHLYKKLGFKVVSQFDYYPYDL